MIGVLTYIRYQTNIRCSERVLASYDSSSVGVAMTLPTSRVSSWTSKIVTSTCLYLVLVFLIVTGTTLHAQSFKSEVDQHRVVGYIDGDLTGITHFDFLHSSDETWLLVFSGGKKERTYVMEKQSIRFNPDGSIQLTMTDVFAPDITVELFKYANGTHVVVIHQLNQELHYITLKNIIDGE